jgi:hypothetical protein
MILLHRIRRRRAVEIIKKLSREKKRGASDPPLTISVCSAGAESMPKGRSDTAPDANTNAETTEKLRAFLNQIVPEREEIS